MMLAGVLVGMLLIVLAHRVYDAWIADRRMARIADRLGQSIAHELVLDELEASWQRARPRYHALARRHMAALQRFAPKGAEASDGDIRDADNGGLK